ncbi:uncharacterized protein [Argopecten irradians]|uniref:uncharacterized protein n=1 Tax=Argopecten irradians TaxID=31199 RepID=UPI0037216D47
MAANTYIVIFIVVIFSLFGLATSVTCYSTVRGEHVFYGDEYYYTDSTDCLYSIGCCSLYGFRPTCCLTDDLYDDIIYSAAMSTGAIAGIVVGCLGGLGIFIGGIICCCCAFHRRPEPSPAGQIMTSVGGGGTTVVSTQNTTTQQAYPQQPYQVQPSPAMALAHPGHQNPAYAPDSKQAGGPGPATYDNTGAVAPPSGTAVYPNTGAVVPPSGTAVYPNTGAVAPPPGTTAYPNAGVVAPPPGTAAYPNAGVVAPPPYSHY